MRSELLLILLLALAGIYGASIYGSSSTSPAQQFDYAAASPDERSAYLETLGRELKSKFKPSYVAKDAEFTTGGRSITFSYNMRMSKVDCDTDHSCKVMQCDRYLKSPASVNNISIRVRYLNARGQQIGSQLLKNSSCASIIDKWKNNSTS